jgi:phosphoglycolate phosphatase
MKRVPRFSSDLLILFDIDGTLMRRSGPAHREALQQAVRTITGIETSTDGIPVHGMLDPDIVTAMLLRAGLSREAIAGAIGSIEEEAQRYYEHACPDLRSAQCPGVKRLLGSLRREKIACVLVTGNLERIGWRKLDRGGLAGYFAFGSFAGTAATRSALAKNAIRLARRRGLVRRDTRIWLVGDAPQDVLAARANGISCVAVHTGVSGVRELGRLRPALLLKNLGRLRASRLLE